MNKIGFLLGAGASYELGMPLVDELTAEFKNGLLRVKNMPYYRCSKQVEEVFIPMLEHSDLNYEDIVGRIEVEINRCRDTKLRQEFQHVKSKCLEAVFALLLERHQRNKEYIKTRLPFLEPIKEFCKDNPLWIFSLNHDLIIEMVAQKFAIPIKFGFDDTVEIKGCHFERLSRESMDKNRFSFLKNSRGINLVKIHGSLDIFVQGDNKNYLKIGNNGADCTGGIDNIERLLKEDAALLQGTRCTNEITYYDENRILQFLRMTIMSGKHKYSNRVSSVMDGWFYSIFKGHINYVDKLYCIGYGFQDSHVNSVIHDWLSFSAKRSMIIVNPSIKSVPNYLKHLSNQVETIDSGFLEFLNKGNVTALVKIKAYNLLRNLAREHLIKTNI